MVPPYWFVFLTLLEERKLDLQSLTSGQRHDIEKEAEILHHKINPDYYAEAGFPWHEELENLGVPHLAAAFNPAYLGLVEAWVPTAGGVTQATLAAYDRGIVLHLRIAAHLELRPSDRDVPYLDLLEEFDEMLAGEENGYVGGDKQILYVDNLRSRYT